jgi:uncharacterized repeat protein (TIGR03803 family)
LLVSLLASGVVQAQVFSTLHAFSGADGSSPSAELTQGPDDNFYGTTQLGGDYDLGTVFTMSASGQLTAIYSLTGPEGADVFAPLLFGRDKELYGVTTLGGPEVLAGKGTIFRFSLSGQYTPLHVFSGNEGARPEAGLAQGSDGWLYGTTTSGGDFGKGTIFGASLDGELRVLHAFAGSDGEMPLGELLPSDDGWLYGTTVSGGAHNGGTLFRVSPTGEFGVLHDFGTDPDDGTSPRGRLVRDSGGAIYGTLEFGAYGSGAVFCVTTDGNYRIVHSFWDRAASTPLAGLILGRDGLLYGTSSSGGTFNAGTVFAVVPTGGLTVLHEFTGGLDGGSPVSGLLQANDGRIYGTTPLGGPWMQGTAYRLTLPGPAIVTSTSTRHHGYSTETIGVELASPTTSLGLTVTLRRVPGVKIVGMDAPDQVQRACRIDARTIVCSFVLRADTVLAAGRYDFGVRMLSAWPRHGGWVGNFDLAYASDGSIFEKTGTLN